MSAEAAPSVVHLLQSGAWGGMEKSAHILVKTQLELNPERRVAVLFAEATGPNIEKFEATGATIIDAKVGSGVALWRAPGLARQMDGWEIAHHYCQFPPFLAAIPFARRARHLFTLRANLTGRQERPTRRLRGWINDLFLRRASGLGANNEFGRARLARRLGLSRDCVAAIPNGFDPPVVDLEAAPRNLRQEFKLEAERRVVVSSGRLSPQKRPYLALKAACLAAKRAPDLPMALLFLGDGGEREALERVAKSEAPPNLRVLFAGWRPDAVELVAGADAYLFSGLMDGFANTVAEAVAVGVPIVAWRDGGGALEHLRHAPAGEAVAAASAEEASARLVEFLERPAASKRRPPATWPYGRFDMAARYEALYERMTRPEPPAAPLQLESRGEAVRAASPPPPLRRREA